VAYWSTKAAISLKRVKIGEQLPWRPIGTHQPSFERYHPRPHMTSSSPRLGFATPTQNSNRHYLFTFGRYIHRFHPNKSPSKILEKRERVHIQRLPKFYGYPPIISKRVTLRTSNFEGIFIASIERKAH